MCYPGLALAFFTVFGQSGRITDSAYPEFRYSLIVNCDATESRKPSIIIILFRTRRGSDDMKGI